MCRCFIRSLVVMSLLATSDGAQSGSQDAAAKKPIGFLRKEHYTDMYGWTYFIKGDHTLPIFFDQSMGRGGAVLMNIDGEDVNLKFVRTSREPNGRKRSGSQISDYAAPGLTVRVASVRGRDVGSGTEYAGTITATKGRRVQTRCASPAFAELKSASAERKRSRSAGWSGKPF